MQGDIYFYIEVVKICQLSLKLRLYISLLPIQDLTNI